MPREFSKRFYNSKEWKRVRKIYISSKFGICERCGKPNAKQVHHKKWLTPENINDPNITFNFQNLELLCDTCHQKEHHEIYSITSWETIFNQNGDLIKVEK